jgi:hypothetical protein
MHTHELISRFGAQIDGGGPVGDSRELKLEGGVVGQELVQPGLQRAFEVGRVNEGIEQRDVGRDSGRPGRRVDAADRLQLGG